MIYQYLVKIKIVIISQNVNTHKRRRNYRKQYDTNIMDNIVQKLHCYYFHSYQNRMRPLSRLTN